MTQEDPRSRPEYEVRLERRVRVPMRDGVELAAVVVRPRAEGRFPAIMSYNPYRWLRQVKDTSSDTTYNHRWDGPPYFAQRGYAVVYFDVRGTGNSGGNTQDLYSDEERLDACDMVEWIAAQPWCSGNVGMWGMSYGGVVQWQVGVQNPPALKTLVIGSSNTDVYLDWTNPGGSIRPYMFDSFAPMMTAFNAAPPDADIVGPHWAGLWEERLEKNVPWGIGLISNLLQGPYWRDRSLQPDYGRIKVPVMFWCGWADPYPTPILRAFSKLDVPKKILLGPWGHYWPEEALPGPRIDFRHEMLKWFDRWLKGEDTGVMKEPAVTLFVRRYKRPVAHMYLEDAGFWRHEDEWPPARNQNTPFYLHPGGELSRKAPTGESAPDDYAYNPAVGISAGIYWGGGIMPWAMPVDQRLDEAWSLTYTTPPLEKDLEVTGNPKAVLHVASSADTAYFHVKLADVAPDGTSKWLADGGLLATHRNSHSEPEPMEPGQVYELEVDLKYVSYLFEKGHCIRVSVASADFQNAWPTAKPAVNRVHRDRQYPSHIVMPITPVQSPQLSAPDLKPSPRPAATMGDISQSTRHEITHDLVDETVTATLERVSETGPAPGLAHSNYTVSRRNPAEAVLQARYVYEVPPAGSGMTVEANESLTSDLESFHFLSQVEVTLGGKRHFQKSWRVSVPRKLN